MILSKSFLTMHYNAFYCVRLELENSLSFIRVNCWRISWMIPWGSNYNCLRKISKNRKSIHVTGHIKFSIAHMGVGRKLWGNCRYNFCWIGRDIDLRHWFLNRNVEFGLRYPKGSPFSGQALHCFLSSSTERSKFKGSFSYHWVAALPF